MNIVYFGSPDFSAEILKSILSPWGSVLQVKRTWRTDPQLKIVGVITTPDKPTGRKQILTPSPVALMAQKYDLPVFKPTKLDQENLAHIKLLKPDIFLVVSYGKIIPKIWLDAPSIGAFNLHFSLLPKYRGALCISEAIKNQDQETGVTLMVMDEQLDHGPIISQEKVAIDINDNCEDLTNKLTHSAIHLISPFPPLNLRGGSEGVILHPQDESLATYTPSTKTRNRQSAFIPWETIKKAMTADSWPLATEMHALIRSLNPDPGAWTKINDQEIKIIKTSLKQSEISNLQSKMIIEQVQLSGKSPISWQQFLAGHPLKI